MKKLMFMLLALPFVALTSCDDDGSDLPDVSLEVEYTGATKADGTLYVVQGEPFAVSSVTAVPQREGAKAAIMSVTYGLDGWVVGATAASPFAIEFDTAEIQTGKHILSMTMGIAEEGCEPATGYYATTIMVVASAEEIPQPGSTEVQGRFDGKPTMSTE